MWATVVHYRLRGADREREREREIHMRCEERLGQADRRCVTLDLLSFCLKSHFLDTGCVELVWMPAKF